MKPFLVLAGGFGTRLRSLVSDVPKPLAPVAGKPFIVHLINHWVEQGVNDFIFLLHYEAEQIEGMLDKLSCHDEFSGVTFKVLVESTPLGTGGAILNAIEFFGITQGFMVANADTWLGSGIQKLGAMKSSAIAAVKVANTQRYGSLNFSDGKVSSFEEKTASIGEGYVNSGLYHLLPDVFDGFEVGSSFSIEKEIFPRLAATRQLEAIKLTESFIDIGVPEDYLTFCKCIEKGKISGN